MKATAFNDDTSFVMVFDNITDEEKTFLIQKFNPTLIGDTAVKRTPKALLEGAEGVAISEKVMSYGALKGLTVIGALREKGDYAFKILSQMITNSHGITEEEISFIKQILNTYVSSRFNMTDEKIQSYVMQLDDAGCNNFVDTFEPIILERMWQAFGFGRNEFNSKTIEEKRRVVYWVCRYWRGETQKAKQNK